MSNTLSCGKHGEGQPAYIVCVHVLDGAPIGQFKDATSDADGEVLCAACIMRMYDTKYIDLFHAICGGCVRDIMAKRVLASGATMA